MSNSFENYRSRRWRNSSRRGREAGWLKSSYKNIIQISIFDTLFSSPTTTTKRLVLISKWYNLIIHGALGYNRIGPTDKHVWNVATHVLHNFWVCHKHNSLLPLGPIYPSSNKELHGWFLTSFLPLLILKNQAIGIRTFGSNIVGANETTELHFGWSKSFWNNFLSFLLQECATFVLFEIPGLIALSSLDRFDNPKIIILLLRNAQDYQRRRMLMQVSAMTFTENNLKTEKHLL